MSNHSELIIVISTVVAFIAVWWIYFKTLRIAKAKNVVDNPDARKLQRTPIPVMGGIAVFFGIVAGMMTGAAMNFMLHDSMPITLLPLAGAMVMLYVGATDDIIGLTPVSRLVIEILVVMALIYGSGACLDNFYGMWNIHELSWWMAVPLTVVACVGIINAVNMIDGVNGLSSGLCIVCSSMFGTAFLRIGDTPNAILAFSMAASLLPFLLHNVFGKHSRMFIGDAGTMVIGVVMGWFVISLLSNRNAQATYIAENDNMIALSLAILSVPVFDTLRVMTMRMMKGRSPFSPDKTHLHHVFIKVGVSHSITSLCEILMDVIIVALWALSAKLDASQDVQVYIVLLSSILLVWGMYVFMHYHIVHHTAFLHWLTRFSIKTHLGHKDWWLRLQQWLDAPEQRDHADERERIHIAHKTRRFLHEAPNTEKEHDRRKILEFMKGKAEVYVDDIINRSGADSMRVYPILFEEEQQGMVDVIKKDGWGAPIIVALYD